jgi:hypothetical protein
LLQVHLVLVGRQVVVQAEAVVAVALLCLLEMLLELMVPMVELVELLYWMVTMLLLLMLQLLVKEELAEAEAVVAVDLQLPVQMGEPVLQALQALMDKL